MLENEINELPEDVVRPRIRKFDIASFPVVILGISSNLDPVELTELIEKFKSDIGSPHIPGVAQVDTWGGFQPRGSHRTGPPIGSKPWGSPWAM